MKLLVIDDHEVLREGIKALFLQTMPHTIVLQADTCALGLAIAEDNHDLDIILLDLSMPDMDGMEAIAEFRRRCPHLPIVVLSALEDPRSVRQALARGARGYVPKTASPQTLVSALQFVLGGNIYVPPLLIKEPASTTAERKNQPELTQRQIEVLQLIEAGLANKEISLKLGVSEKTVKAHVSAIFRFLNVVNRTQAANVARQRNLI